jgi:predicted LPLAT superfamily acyltransferase
MITSFWHGLGYPVVKELAAVHSLRPFQHAFLLTPTTIPSSPLIPQSIISASLNFATRLKTQGKRKAHQGSFSLMNVAVVT